MLSGFYFAVLFPVVVNSHFLFFCKFFILWQLFSFSVSLHFHFVVSSLFCNDFFLLLKLFTFIFVMSSLFCCDFFHLLWVFIWVNIFILSLSIFKTINEFLTVFLSRYVFYLDMLYIFPLFTFKVPLRSGWKVAKLYLQILHFQVFQEIRFYLHPG